MRKLNYIFIFFLFIATFSYSNAEETKISELAELKTNPNKLFYAGTEIELIFSCESKIMPMLYVNNSYGSTLLNANSENELLHFKLPKPFSKKTGDVNWSLVLNKDIILRGTITILSNNDTETVLENYFGPRQIQAGDNDYSMLVTVPTDGFDNPLPENTPVFIRQQFLNEIKTTEEKTDYLIAWQNIYSTRKAGIINVTSLCNTTYSKELMTEIYPSNATDFEIDYFRNHNFADGNQQTEFFSSVIKDEFGNIVSDGTLVDFLVINSKNYKLKTIGETVNGIAKAKMLHPEFQDEWKVKAFVTGMAESNELTISFASVLSDFNVGFFNENRQITVGPLQSFMNQKIPDGIKVTLYILKDGKETETKIKFTSDGQVIFYLEPEFYKNGLYNFRIETLGLSKDFNQFELK